MENKELEMRWSALEEKCRSCHACPLGDTRTNCVFGTGSRTARLMFVGEAPGEQEDASGVPFVGRAGQLLDRYLYAVDIPREDVYIANILKCRPPKNSDVTNDLIILLTESPWYIPEMSLLAMRS